RLDERVANLAEHAVGGRYLLGAVLSVEPHPAFVAHDAPELETRRAIDQPGEPERLGDRAHSAAVQQDVDVHQDANGGAAADRGAGHAAHWLRVVSGDGYRCALRQNGNALDLGSVHDLVRDEHVFDPRGHHYLSLADRGAGHATSLPAELAPGELGGAVRLDVGPHRLSCSAQQPG